MPKIGICDPHFHIWDQVQRPNPNLGEAVVDHLPTYTVVDYKRDMDTLPADLELRSAIHVETVVGQMLGGFVLDPISETRWVASQLESHADHLPFGIVAYVHMAQDTGKAARMIEEHIEAAKGRLRGIRMILNHHSRNPDLTWAQVETDTFLCSTTMREGMGLLNAHGLAFDLSCNPHQVEDAAHLFGAFPDLPVVVNHLGFLHDGEHPDHEVLWRASIKQLAALPNIYMKLSMLWFARRAYQADTMVERKVRDLVREVIDHFGVDRCMFASNYPVDRIQNIEISALYGMFLEWTSDFGQDEQEALFHNTALRAYGSLR